jgi:hypothetical protein
MGRAGFETDHRTRRPTSYRPGAARRPRALSRALPQARSRTSEPGGAAAAKLTALDLPHRADSMAPTPRVLKQTKSCRRSFDFLPKVNFPIFYLRNGPPRVPKTKGLRLLEVFPQYNQKVRTTFVDQLSILFHKSAANFLSVSREDCVPVQITRFSTLTTLRKL